MRAHAWMPPCHQLCGPMVGHVPYSGWLVWAAPGWGSGWLLGPGGRGTGQQEEGAARCWLKQRASRWPSSTQQHPRGARTVVTGATGPNAGRSVLQGGDTDSVRQRVTRRCPLRQEEDEGWKMSPSVFLRTIEEGNNLYKGQFGRICMTTGVSVCPPSVTPDPNAQPLAGE